jgi:hypothetical protein
VGRIVSSPYCRARDTARLAFGRVDDETLALKEGGDELAALLETLPREGPNTVLAGHSLEQAQPPLRLPVLEEGEALVLVLEDDGNARHVARVEPAEWATLADDA